MHTSVPSVCVIIAAYNASDTIARAIKSALAEDEVAEVIVVDDASSDETRTAALACADASSRLSVHRFDQNTGPSKARNYAIAQSRSPLIAILDADDFILPGRFAALLAVADWDMIADNIVFVPDDGVDGLDPRAVSEHLIEPRVLTAAAFVEGSISRADRYKGELGFLKPLLSRAFLDRHGIRYAEDMRLSEDYDLYVRALISGARFRLAKGCHYVAVERRGSLSVAHGVAELVAVDHALVRLRGLAKASDKALRDALRRHHVQIRRKRRHRALLVRKREIGIWRALAECAHEPTALAGVLADILRDKLRPIKIRYTKPKRQTFRFLL